MNYRRLEQLGIVVGTMTLLYGHFLLLKNLEFTLLSVLFFSLSICCGIIVADFVSGTVHWFADTFGHEAWPLLGPSLIRPFREHHTDPASITRHDFIETNGSSFLLVAVASILLFIFTDTRILGYLSPTLFFLSITNELHKMAHLADHAPTWFKKLAAKGWLLSANKHRKHHSGNFDRHFCITTGWLNDSLDRVHFFKSIEKFIAAVAQRLGRLKYDPK